MVQEKQSEIDHLRAEEDVDGLIEALGSEDGLTRQKAALALGDLGAAAGPLIRALGDPVMAVREAAADSLAMLGSAVVGPLIEIIEDPGASGKYEETAASVIDPGGQRWEVAIRQDLRRVRAAAILGEIGDSAAVETLIGAFHGADDDLRCHAGTPVKFEDVAVEPLTAALTDPDPDIRIIAVGILGGTGDPAAAGPLVAALRDGNPDVRGAAGSALIRLGDAAIEPLIAATKDADRNVRVYAAGALKYIGDARAIDALQDLARSGDAEERSIAKDALEKIYREAPGPSAPTSR